MYYIYSYNINTDFQSLTWYQSYCSKCFVQSSSFLAFLRCLNHLRYCSLAAVRIPMCPLPSKVEQSPKTHCLRWNSLSRTPIETPPPPLESFLEDDLNRAKITAIRRRTRLHAPIRDSASQSCHVTRPTRQLIPVTPRQPKTQSALTPRHVSPNPRQP